MIAVILFVGILFIAAVVALVVGLMSLKNRVVSGKEGMSGEYGEAVDDFIDGRGQVKVHGEVWEARSKEEILRGDEIVVISAEGLRLFVEKLKTNS